MKRDRSGAAGVFLVCVLGAGCSSAGDSTDPPYNGPPANEDPKSDGGATKHDASTGGQTTPDAATPEEDASQPAPDAAVKPTCAPGLPTSVSDLASLVTQSTVSKVTPMGTNFETPAKHTVTSAELTFLGDPKQSPPVPSTLSGLHMKTFPVTLYPSGTPTPADINQHAIGDCDGDTAMASMAYMNPDFVQSIITDNHDNTFAVAMFDPKGKPLTVKVDNSFLADSGNNIAAVSGKKDAATWTTVLEKAVMKYNNVFNFIGDIQGIGSEHLTPLFTGEGGSFAFNRGALTPDQLTRAVKASLAAGKFISGGFGTEQKLGNVTSITAHGYAVFYPPDDATMVAMRNPWGVSPLASGGGYDTTTDGVLNIPPTKTWSNDIDLRIIDPGAACSAGVTTPYAPVMQNVISGPVRISERHIAR